MPSIVRFIARAATLSFPAQPENMRTPCLAVTMTDTVARNSKAARDCGSHILGSRRPAPKTLLLFIDLSIAVNVIFQRPPAVFGLSSSCLLRHPQGKT
ncbi:unnamed protein product, partial [Iphiclides podalirius]